MPLVEIAAYDDPVLADIVRGRLESEGVGAVLFNRDLAHVFGGLPVLGQVKLMVLDEDEQRARAVLDSSPPDRNGP